MSKELQTTAGSEMSIDDFMEDLGLDLDQELQDTAEGVSVLPPQLKWEGPSAGRAPYLFVDAGENADGESQIEELDGPASFIVAMHNPARIYFEPGNVMPTCSAIRGVPLPSIPDPVNPTCDGCLMNKFGSDCKPIQRLFVVPTDDLSDKYPALALTLPPTSLKHWRRYVQRLLRSKLPIIAVVTEMSLEEVNKSGYSWAEAILRFKGIAPKEQILRAKSIREEWEKWMSSAPIPNYVPENGDRSDSGDSGGSWTTTDNDAPPPEDPGDGLPF